jgi:hypothetical protein
MSDRLLRIYLQDHHAAATAGTSLARRALGESELRSLTLEIESDKRTLEGVMRRIDISPSLGKVVAATLGERLARLKPNGRFAARSPLSDLLELETLEVGVKGKRAMWAALADLDDTRLRGIDFDALAASADRQAQVIESARLRAASTALAGSKAGD